MIALKCKYCGSVRIGQGSEDEFVCQDCKKSLHLWETLFVVITEKLNELMPVSLG